MISPQTTDAVQDLQNLIAMAIVMDRCQNHVAAMQAEIDTHGRARSLAGLSGKSMNRTPFKEIEMTGNKTAETRLRRAQREVRTADMHHARAKAKLQAAHDLGQPVQAETATLLADADARKRLAERELSQARKEADDKDRGP